MIGNSAVMLEDASTPSEAGQSQYLTFMLGGETFAMGILAIREIIEYDRLTVVPMMPSCVRGVINLRGAVVPVIDLAARFDRGASDIGRRTCVVIVEADTDGGRQDVGIIVDAVNEVVDIPAAEIEPAPAFGAGMRTDFIRGMGKLDDRFVILLDVDRVVSMDGMQPAQDSAAVAALHEAATSAA